MHWLSSSSVKRPRSARGIQSPSTSIPVMFTCSTAKANGQMLVDGTPSGLDGNVDDVGEMEQACASIRSLGADAGAGCAEMSKSEYRALLPKQAGSLPSRCVAVNLAPPG